MTRLWIETAVYAISTHCLLLDMSSTYQRYWAALVRALRPRPLRFYGQLGRDVDEALKAGGL